ncbi:MAG: thioredoxin family protein [Prevotellaceae bacterium]|nr:thioredoxin family protein [Prevotellaceae bacterium]MDY3857076.1 thioredoxin family protein [Bacteroidaceae bacterium]
MNKKTILTLFCFFSFSVLFATAQSGVKQVYNPALDPMAQIDSALALTQRTEEPKYVLCQLGGNWCPWCLLFAEFVSRDTDINQLIQDNYVYIHVNYDPHLNHDESQKAKTKALLDRLGKPQRFGFPVLIILDQQGKVIHIQDSSFLEEGQGYNKKKVLRFLKSWRPKAVNPSI